MKKLLSHNQGLSCAIVACVLFFVWVFGCHSTVKSLVSEEKISREELTVELTTQIQRLENDIITLQKTAELRYAELDRQEELRRMLFEIASLTATTGTFNATALITLAGSILGIGAVVDNRIKDKVIKNRPLPKKETT